MIEKRHVILSGGGRIKKEICRKYRSDISGLYCNIFPVSSLPNLEENGMVWYDMRKLKKQKFAQ